MSIFSAKKQLSVSDLARAIYLFINNNNVHGVQERQEQKQSVWDLIGIFLIP